MSTAPLEATVSRWLRLELAAKVASQDLACRLLDDIAKEIDHASGRSDQTAEPFTYEFDLSREPFGAKRLLRLAITYCGEPAEAEAIINLLMERIVEATQRAYASHPGLTLATKALRHPEEE